MKNITDLGNGKYLVRCTKQLGKKRLSRKRTVESKVEAVAAEAELNKELIDTLTGGSKDTLKVFAEEWFEHIAQGYGQPLRPATLTKHRQALDKWIIPCLGHLELLEVKPSHLAAIKIQMRDSGLAHGTISTYYQTLSKLLNDARVLRDIPYSAAQGLKVNVGSLVPTKTKQVLTAEELSAFIEHTKILKFDVQVLLCIQATTGLRIGEITPLVPSDLQGNSLSITKSQVRGHVGPPKTENGQRIVPLQPWLVKMIQEIPAWQKANLVYNPIGLLFPSAKGAYRFPTTTVDPIARVCRAAGIKKHISNHCFRHGIVSLMAENGVDEMLLRKVVGHAAGAKAISDRYNHPTSEAREGAYTKALKGVSGPAPKLKLVS